MAGSAGPLLRQVALAAGSNLDATLAFWDAMLGMPTHARFDPPGIAFIYAGPVRLFFSSSSLPGTVYLDVPNVDRLHADLTERGVIFDMAPAILYHDGPGEFGPAGESEWMAFLKDPAGNTIGLVTRRS
jgi:catechol 2,3-dioxygenase-like lactoylglutathione lyase family enzyme